MVSIVCGRCELFVVPTEVGVKRSAMKVLNGRRQSGHLPKRAQASLGLTPGTRLLWHANGDVLMRAKSKSLLELAGSVKFQGKWVDHFGHDSVATLPRVISEANLGAVSTMRDERKAKLPQAPHMPQLAARSMHLRFSPSVGVAL